jgi:hypothetical protein
VAQVSVANPSTTAKSERQRSLVGSFLHRLWYNRTVSDEELFVREFRSHSFRFVLVATWTLAIVRTFIIAYQRLFGADRHEPLLQVLTSGALLYWALPVVFWLFKDWSRRYYPWALDCFYAVYFVKVGLRVTDGSPQLDDANVPMLILIITSVIFLRIPFRHALVLTATSIAAIDVLAVARYGPTASFRLMFSTGFTLAMALYTSWGMEERDRGLFSKRLEAAAQAREAQRAAAQEQAQRIRPSAPPPRLSSPRARSNASTIS